MMSLVNRLREMADYGEKHNTVYEANCQTLRDAADRLETLEWFAEHAYSLKDRERAREALGL